MHSSTQHLAAILMLLAAGAEQVVSRGYHHHGHHRPVAFFHPSEIDMTRGAFRPFFTGGSRRARENRGGRGGAFTTASPIIDIFQDVVGDIKQVAREFVEQSSGPNLVPQHELIETSTTVTLYVDLPGCKKQDVDAQISEASGTKTLKITALRRKPRGGEHSATAATANASERTEERSEEQSSTSEASSPGSPEFKEETFELSFLIGEGVDATGVRGSMEDGVLTLVIPKATPEPPAEPIDIPIDPPAASSSENGQSSRAEGETEVPTDAAENTHISLS